MTNIFRHEKSHQVYGITGIVPIHRSEYALMYNDRSVLENHHLHHTFTLLREVRSTSELLTIIIYHITGVLASVVHASLPAVLPPSLHRNSLTSSLGWLLRSTSQCEGWSSIWSWLLTCPHILTSSRTPELHWQLLTGTQAVTIATTHPTVSPYYFYFIIIFIYFSSELFFSCSGSQLLGSDRSKTFSLILHLADISHPGKKWAEHLEWSDRLCQEFFCQGDRERSLGLPLSPLCDRDHTNLPDSQIGTCVAVWGCACVCRYTTADGCNIISGSFIQ